MECEMGKRSKAVLLHGGVPDWALDWDDPVSGRAVCRVELCGHSYSFGFVVPLHEVPAEFWSSFGVVLQWSRAPSWFLPAGWRVVPGCGAWREFVDQRDRAALAEPPSPTGEVH